MAEPTGEFRVEKVVDYLVTLSSGREQEFTVRPEQGDEEKMTTGMLYLKLAKTGHEIAIYYKDVAVMSRREREMRHPVKFEPKVVGGSERFSDR